MTGVLSGLRVIEGSAFVAAPTCGMTLAQLGADVIRFDMIGGGIDYRRWPVTAEGNSIYWAGLNKGKRSIAVDFRKPEGQKILSNLITQTGDDRGILLTNFPMKGWLSYDTLQAKRGGEGPLEATSLETQPMTLDEFLSLLRQVTLTLTLTLQPEP